MKKIINKLALATLAGALIAPAVEAQTVVTFVGGNATQKIIQNRIAVLTNDSSSPFYEANLVNGSASTIFSYTNSSYTVNFNLSGGAGAIDDLYGQTPVSVAVGSPIAPNAAISITGPGTIGYTNAEITNLTEIPTLAAPVVFAINTNLPNAFGNIWNLTSRQAIILETDSGDQGGNILATAALGGSSTTDPIYFVGRNSLAAVRNVTDANIYFDYPEVYGLTPPTFVTWTTNGSGQPVKASGGDPGSSSGSQVAALLNTISNAVGTLAIGDVAPNFTLLAYEGVPFNVTNVENGSYPLWGVERYLYGAPGNSASIPVPTTANGLLQPITNLIAAVTDPAFEATNTQVFAGLYVPLTGLNSGAPNISGVNNGGVSRDHDYDGLPIAPAPYNNILPYTTYPTNGASF